MARILVLEDEKAINDLVALNLSMVGHTTVQTFTGGEALKAASIQPPDVHRRGSAEGGVDSADRPYDHRRDAAGHGRLHGL